MEAQSMSSQLHAMHGTYTDVFMYTKAQQIARLFLSKYIA
jgi:hypothetical protein